MRLEAKRSRLASELEAERSRFASGLEVERSRLASGLEVERKNLTLLVEEAKTQLTLRSDLQKSELNAQIAHLSNQLEKLYGPLAFLLYEGRYSFSDLVDTMGRSYIFPPDGQLAPDELELWLFWIEHDLMPRNSAVQRLLASNAHLIEGETIPQSYWSFIDHYNSWRVTHQRWVDKQVPYSWHSKTNWPTEFEIEVIATFNELKRKHSVLIGMLAAEQ